MLSLFICLWISGCVVESNMFIIFSRQWWYYSVDIIHYFSCNICHRPFALLRKVNKNTLVTVQYLSTRYQFYVVQNGVYFCRWNYFLQKCGYSDSGGTLWTNQHVPVIQQALIIVIFTIVKFAEYPRHGVWVKIRLIIGLCDFSVVVITSWCKLTFLINHLSLFFNHIWITFLICCKQF